MSQLQQIVYVSRVAGQLSALELRGILHLARRANRRSDITGVLICTGRSFLQVLEGDEHALAALLESLAHDPRHLDLRVLSRVPISQRAHGDWDMALVSSLDLADEIDAIATDAPSASPDTVQDLARSLASHGHFGDGDMTRRFARL